MLLVDGSSRVGRTMAVVPPLRRIGGRRPGDVRAPRPMTPLARGAEIHPGGVVGPRRRRVAVVLLADVTADAVLVPLLDRVGVLFVGPDDVDVVEPLPSQHIPGRGQDDDAPAVDGGQVVLNPAVAERVVDAVLDGLAGERRLGDVERAVRRPQAIRLAVQRQPRLREVAQGGLGPGRLDHPAVAAALPGLVLVAVTGRAGRGADGDGLAIDRAGSRADRGGPRALRPDRSGPAQREHARDEGHRS